MKTLIFNFCIALIAITNALTVKANVRMPFIFSDHMVLQQNMPVKIWGWAEPGERITVSLKNQSAKVITGKDGKWNLSLPVLKAGGPFILSVKGKNLITFKDVMIGEVWLCSGQSNMVFDLKSSANGKEEIARSTNNNLRHFQVPNHLSTSPQENFEGGSWQVASPETSGDFSAVAYYYGKKLSSELNVAVGLINASWGGTFIESWISYDALHALPDYCMYSQLTLEELEKWFVSIEKKYDQIYSDLHILNRDSITEDSANWKKPDFDDSKWLSVDLPQTFDYELLPRFDGVAWFRFEIDLPSEIAGKGITLHLGKMDDYDITFVNGGQVGSTMGVFAERAYFVPSSKLKTEKNVIAIRILDYWERGGFMSTVSDFKITSGNWEKSIAGNWKMTIAKQTFMWIRTPNVHPNLLFNAMINPILNFPIKGAIWYQGENNCLFAYQYRFLLPALIQDWRKQFNLGEFPFYFVQLPNMGSFNNNSQNGGSDWADLRESQTFALKLPNTGMAVAIDLGDSSNVHPANKTEVANRLALLSLKNTYKQNRGEVASPMANETVFENNRAIIRFTNIGEGLVTRDRYGYLKGFELAGDDKKFHFAQAEIKGDTVIVYSASVKKPVAVRYAWSSNPSDANLYNKESFPASPFRSDTWELPTQGFRYQNWIK